MARAIFGSTGPAFDPGLVSVIIAGYNCAEFVAPTLESVLGQSYPRVEVLFVDDGSTDATEAAVRRFEPGVRYLHQANAGVSRARNAGIAVASGEYLAFLDHDDLWDRDKLERQVATLAAHPDAVLCFTRARVVGAPWMPSLVPMPGTVPGDDTGGATALRLGYRDLVHRNFVALSTILVRRPPTAGARLGFRPDLRLAEDYQFLLDAAEQGDLRFVRETLVSYVIRAGRSSARMADMSLEELQVVDEACRAHPELRRESPELVRDRLWDLSKQAGYCLWREGRSSEARRLLQRAIRLQPTALSPWLYWAASWVTRPRAMAD